MVEDAESLASQGFPEEDLSEWDPENPGRIVPLGPEMQALMPKRRRFVHEYLATGLDAPEAAYRAGYSPISGYPLVSKCADAILEEQTARQQRLRITADRVVQEIALIAFSDISDYITVKDGRVSFNDLGTIPADKRKAIAEMSQVDTENSSRISFKLHPKMDALKLACKHLGIAIDKLVVQGDTQGGPIRHQHEFVLPPKPQTIADWEEQAREAERIAEQAAEETMAADRALPAPEDLYDPEFDEQD